MKKIAWITPILLIAVAGMSFTTTSWLQATENSQKESKMKTMTIKWQRLTDDAGQTCDRCGTTQDEVHKAYTLLRKSLSPLGINVVLEEKKIDKATAIKDIAESNRIWVAGKPIETWLGAKAGASDCSSCGTICGKDVDCRTVVIDGNSYEVIPSALIIKAGLLAAADIVGAEAAQTCCPSDGLPATPQGGCSGGSCGSGGCK